MSMIDIKFSKPPQQKLDTLLEYYKSGRYVDAEKLSLLITSEFPDHPFSWKVLGAILQQNGKLSESLFAIQKSILLNPNDNEAHNNLGNLFLQQGKLKEAENCYTYAIKLNPDFAEAHNNLGVVLKNQNRVGESESSYRQAIILKPNFAEAHNNLGNILQKLDRIKEAEAQLKKTILIKPDYVEAHYNLGSLFLKINKPDEAEECFKKVLEINPNHEEAKHLLSSLTGKTTESPPKVFVERLFNEYASIFENDLINNLGYHLPKKVTELIVNKKTNIQLGQVLDLGCGTGLLGNDIKKYCSNLVGVDLSKSMLEIARVKNIYDKLIHDDIVEFLSSKNLNFNYFISLDTFDYIGDLSKIFSLIKSHNKIKGKFIFSTEHTDRNKFFFFFFGRYSHSKKYI